MGLFIIAFKAAQFSRGRLRDIEDEETKKMPSWSWMKYSGAICYGTILGKLDLTRDGIMISRSSRAKNTN